MGRVFLDSILLDLIDFYGVGLGWGFGLFWISLVGLYWPATRPPVRCCALPRYVSRWSEAVPIVLSKALGCPSVGYPC